VVARQLDGIHAVAGLDYGIATRFQKFVEELHVELVVFDDHHCLGHGIRPWQLRALVFCPMARVTSIAYETRNGRVALALKIPEPSLDELAELCFTYLLNNPQQLMEFMSITGLDPDGLRRAVGTDSFKRGLLDHVVQNEPLLLAVCESGRLRPEAVMRAWAKLNPAG